MKRKIIENEKNKTTKRQKHKPCQYPGCKKQPIFNEKGKKVGFFCADHKEPDMVDVKNRRCRHPGCTKRPVFNKEGEPFGVFCVNHKVPDMVNITSKRCKHQGCKKQPYFNKKGQSGGIFCADHKEPDMINVRKNVSRRQCKTCQHPGCRKYPHFNNVGQSLGIFCGDHKELNMIDVQNRRCKHPECKKRPHFNNEGQIVGIFCADHKETNMVNVKNRRCEHPGCTKQPVFNDKDKSVGLFCGDHKKRDMINVRDRQCQHQECKKRTYYGIPGYSASHCAEHKQDGMIRKSKSRCLTKSCKQTAFYGITFPQRCESHKLPDDYNLVEKKCESCGLLEVLVPLSILQVLGRDRKCGNCNPEVFRRVRLAKQREIKTFLDVNEIKYIFYDSIIDAKCSKKRPDFVIDANAHMICLEVDENGHINYSCEENRMKELTQALGMPTIWIRYNPDSFKRQKGDTTKWTKNKRQSLLLEWIKKCQKTPPKDETEYCRILYLFYDCFQPSSASFQTLNMNVQS